MVTVILQVKYTVLNVIYTFFFHCKAYALCSALCCRCYSLFISHQSNRIAEPESHTRKTLRKGRQRQHLLNHFRYFHIMKYNPFKYLLNNNNIIYTNMCTGVWCNTLNDINLIWLNRVKPVN